MKKIQNYFETGKGHGLLLVFCVSLLLSVFSSILIFQEVKQQVVSPQVQEFIDSFPTFKIEGGFIQDRYLNWSSVIPFLDYPIVIDTTRSNIVTPAPDGVYITRKALYYVTKHGTQLERMEFEADVEVSPAYLRTVLNQVVLAVAIVVGIMAFFVLWFVFLFGLALSILASLIFGLNFGQGRIWRISAVTWCLVHIFVFALSFVDMRSSGWFFVLMVAANVWILSKLKKE